MDEGSRPVTMAEWSAPQPISPRRLPALAARAIRLVLSAAPKEFALVVGLQTVAGLGLAVPILGGRELLTSALQHDADLAAVLTKGVIVLAVLGAIGLASAVASSRDDVLSELLNRYAMGRILDVARSVPLEDFERPEFHNRMERAAMSARIRPHQLTQGLIALSGALAGTAGVALALGAIEPLLIPATLVAGVPLWLAGLKGGQLLYDALFPSHTASPPYDQRTTSTSCTTDRSPNTAPTTNSSPPKDATQRCSPSRPPPTSTRPDAPPRRRCRAAAGSSPCRRAPGTPGRTRRGGRRDAG